MTLLFSLVWTILLSVELFLLYDRSDISQRECCGYAFPRISSAVRADCDQDSEGPSTGSRSRVLDRAVLAFRLSCIEQLVPVLYAQTIEAHVVPMCLPYAAPKALEILLIS